MSGEQPHVDAAGCGANAAPYVLGALTEQEHREFVVHLRSCAVCREEVAALEVVAAALPSAATPLRAPSELRSKVIAEAQGDAARRGVREPRRAWNASLGGLVRRPVLGAGALVAAVVALAVVLLTGGGGGATHVYRAEVHAPHATASVSVSDGHAQLTVANMPQTPPNRVYEVWIKRSGQPQPTDALFTVTSHGSATVGVPGDIRGVKVIMVTSEPLGGTSVPTSAPVIVARLS